MSLSRLMLFALLGNLLAGSLYAADATLEVPITFTLDRAATVTVVIEDAAGKRVRNLVAAMRLSAGTNRLTWDGYDDGERQDDGSTIRRLVTPGRYLARGVTSDGLKLIYEFPVNSPGTPPWFTADRSGAWLADHTGAQAVVMVPSSDQGFLGRGQSRLIVAAITAECGDAFMALDLDGKKIIGNNDFGWTGAYAMTLDRGPNRGTGAADPWLYCLIPEGRSVKLNAFTTGGTAFNVLNHTSRNEVTWNGGHTGDSVTAWNGRAVVSVPHDGELLVVDGAGKRLVGTIPLPDVRGVLFDSQGRLLAATATQIRRLTIDLATATVSLNEPLITSNLVDAQQLTLDSAGNLYVGDWGTQHVVKVFNPAGQLVRTIGKPGGPLLGRFDGERLQYPKGMAIDERGQLWIADADHLPKRITAWSTSTGAQLRSFIGGPKYGGGGTLDPGDRTRMYYGIFNGGYSLKLDWTAGTSVVESVHARPETNPTINPDNVPGVNASDALRVGGRTYLAYHYNPDLRGNPNNCAIWMIDDNQIARPVAIIGGQYLMEESHGSWNPLGNPGVSDLFNSLNWHDLLIWSDKNLDGRAQPSEFSNWTVEHPYTQGVRFQSDMSFIARNLTMPAPTILPNGVPVWSSDLRPTVVTGSLVPSNSVLVDQGDVVGFIGDGLAGIRNGQIRWTYPSESNATIASDPGMMVEATRFLGPPFKAAVGEAGTVVGINGEKGSLYLLTSDGLFLQDLGGDARVAKHMSTFTTATRGMAVEGVSFYDEHFGPSLQQTAEGDVVMIAGKEFSAIFRVDGLASVKRRDFTTIDLDADRLAGLPPTKVVVPRQQTRQSLAVGLGGNAPLVDGRIHPAEWPSDTASRATLDARASAHLRIVGDRLYAAWRTGDPAALANATGEPKLLFKRGGAVDLMIAGDRNANPDRGDPVAGDLRLLVSKQDGAPIAVLYRAVFPGAAEADRVPFESPVGRVVFDRVDVVTDQIQLAQIDGDIELSVPLALVGLTGLGEGMSVLGDIGILRGTGAITTQRLYWNNLDTSITADVPSEARLKPANWGQWNLVASSLSPLPELDVDRGSRAIADGATDALFSVAVGAPQTLTYVLTNPGTTDLGVTVPVSLSSLSNCTATLVTQPSTTIAAGASSTLVVQVTPAATGAWSFTVTVLSTDSDESPYTWTVSGSDVAGGGSGGGGLPVGGGSGGGAGGGAGAGGNATGGAGGSRGCGLGSGFSLLAGALVVGLVRRRRME